MSYGHQILCTSKLSQVLSNKAKLLYTGCTSYLPPMMRKEIAIWIAGTVQHHRASKRPFALHPRVGLFSD